VHPFLDALLRRYCDERLLDYRGLRALIERNEVPPQHVLDIAERELGLAPSAWLRGKSMATAPMPGKTMVTATTVPRHPSNVDGRGRRRQPSTPQARRIYAWLDSSGILTVQQLTQNVSKLLGRDISRASMRNYVDGMQSTPHGKQPVRVPMDVRQAIEKLSDGAIPVSSWSDPE